MTPEELAAMRDEAWELLRQWHQVDTGTHAPGQGERPGQPSDKAGPPLSHQ